MVDDSRFSVPSTPHPYPTCEDAATVGSYGVELGTRDWILHFHMPRV